MYLDELQDWLVLEHDVLISTTSLHDNIQDAGLTYKLLRRRAAERDEVARDQWKEDVWLNFVVAQMVWTDESSKDDHTIYRHYGRAVRATLRRGHSYTKILRDRGEPNRRDTLTQW